MNREHRVEINFGCETTEVSRSGFYDWKDRPPSERPLENAVLVEQIRAAYALEHHISEEEGKIFDAAKAIFTDQEAEMMGEAFEKLKPGIEKEGFMATTGELIANLLPSRLAKTFRTLNLASRIK